VTLRSETDPLGVRTLWRDRPGKRNALDEPLLTALAQVAEDVLRDEAVRLVLLRSTSPTFCAGADLNEWADVSSREAQRLSSLGSRAFQALADLPVPVVAVIEGAALGGGFELALACDLRIGTPSCRVGFPEPRLGNSPAWGGIPRLVEVAGMAAARLMLLTGDVLTAEEARHLGILQRLVPAEALASGVAALVESVLACDPETLRFIKAVLGPAAQAVAAQEAAMAGYTAMRAESRGRKQAFLASRRGTAPGI
jgi:enoyl-CoA hydratase/carnithine racemase